MREIKYNKIDKLFLDMLDSIDSFGIKLQKFIDNKLITLFK